DLSPRFIAPAQIESGFQYGVIQHVRFFWRSPDQGRTRVGGGTVNRRSLGPKRPSHDRNAIIVTADGFQVIEHRSQPSSRRSEIGDFAHRAAISVNTHFVKLAERPLQS